MCNVHRLRNRCFNVLLLDYTKFVNGVIGRVFECGLDDCASLKLSVYLYMKVLHDLVPFGPFLGNIFLEVIGRGLRSEVDVLWLIII